MVAGYLTKKSKGIIKQTVKLYSAVNKADDSYERADKILSEIDIDFSDLVPELNEALAVIAKEGVKAGAAQIKLTDANVITLANERAEEWAADRAAELVGMKWIDGELVTNPDAEWSISESTRDMIRCDVSNAMTDGWSNQKLRNELVDNQGFSKDRAMMIARTETAFADVQGNLAAYTEAKDTSLDVKVQWLTAGDDLVSEECEMNDQEIREIGDEFPSGATEPPQHPNCRCVLAPVVVDISEQQ